MRRHMHPASPETPTGGTPAGESPCGDSSCGDSPAEAPIDIDALARLARLALTPEEKNDAEHYLREMLDMAQALGHATAPATAGQEAPPCNTLREDVPAPPRERAWLLAGAPAAEAGFLRIPEEMHPEGIFPEGGKPGE